MALTFGTLLSSQGADAHRHGPFGTIRGNPRNFTPVGEPRSNNRHRPDFPLGRRTRPVSGRGAPRLGELFDRLPRGLRPPNKDNITNALQPTSNSLGEATGTPDLLVPVAPRPDPQTSRS